MFGGGGSARFSLWLRSENRDEPERIISSGFFSFADSTDSSGPVSQVVSMIASIALR
jgi:hypothetical protein